MNCGNVKVVVIWEYNIFKIYFSTCPWLVSVEFFIDDVDQSETDQNLWYFCHHLKDFEKVEVILFFFFKFLAALYGDII